MFIGGNQRWMSRNASKAVARRVEATFATSDHHKDKRRERSSADVLLPAGKKVEVVVVRRKLPKKPV